MLKFTLEKDSSKFLLLLILADAFFIVIHVLHVFLPVLQAYGGPLTAQAFNWAWEIANNKMWDIGTDRGAAEVFQYVKDYWIMTIFFWLAVRSFELLYLAYSLLFGYFLLDDAFQFHEVLGNIVASYLQYAP